MKFTQFTLRTLQAALTLSSLTLAQFSHADIRHPIDKMALQYADPQCVIGNIASGSDSTQGWTHGILTLSNQCAYAINLQNSRITFDAASPLTGSWWLNTPTTLSYPNSTNTLTSEVDPNSPKEYLVSLPLGFALYSGVNTKLAPQQTVSFSFGAKKADFDPSSVKVILSQPIATGNIELNSVSEQPSGITTAATIDILQNKRLITKVALDWHHSAVARGLAAGHYTVQPEALSDDHGTSYVGRATPNDVTVSTGATAATQIEYSAVSMPGRINIQAPSLPRALDGYTAKPMVTLTQADGSGTQTAVLNWGDSQPSTVDGLVNGASYHFSSQAINWRDSHCVASFAPPSLVSSATQVPLTQLSYQCSAQPQDHVNLTVSGLPATLNSVRITLTPSDGASDTVKDIALQNGSGSVALDLTDGALYQVTPLAPSGYTFQLSQQPWSITANSTETITFSKQSYTTVFSAYKDVGTDAIWWSADPSQLDLIGTKVMDPTRANAQPILSTLPTSMHALTWAFATGDCSNENWAGIPRDDFIKNNVAAFNHAKVNYIVSTGGSGGGFTCSSSTALKAFADRYQSAYFTGLDFDIEGGRLSATQIASLVNAVAGLKADPHYANLRVSFTLATLAATDNSHASLNVEGEEVMKAIQASGLQDYYINLMAMDYGTPASPSVCVVNARTGLCDMGQSVIQAVKNFHASFPAVPLNHIEVTPLLGVNDIADEIFTLADAKTVAAYVSQQQLGGLHYWSYDRDRACTAGTNLTQSCNGIPGIAPLAFANVFANMANASQG